MSSKRFLIYLTCEVLAIVVAMLSFRFIHWRILAGVIAGVSFISVGFLIIAPAWNHRHLIKTWGFPIALVHLFGVALPMFIMRLSKPEVVFAELNIWGMAGPDFHRLSTNVYFVLMLATTVDLLLAFRREHVARRTTKPK